MRRYEGDDKYQDREDRRGPKGKSMAATMQEVERLCAGWFLQGCQQPITVYEVTDRKRYEPGFHMVLGDESEKGRRMLGQCRVKFVKVVPVPCATTTN